MISRSIILADNPQPYEIIEWPPCHCRAACYCCSHENRDADTEQLAAVGFIRITADEVQLFARVMQTLHRHPLASTLLSTANSKPYCDVTFGRCHWHMH